MVTRLLKFKHLLAILIATTLLQIGVLANAQAETLPTTTTAIPNVKNENVLVIWSYPRSYPWMMAIDHHFNQYVRDKLTSEQTNTVIHLAEESLPYIGLESIPWQQSLLDYLQAKYAQSHFDRIVLVGETAAQFMDRNYSLFNFNTVYKIARHQGKSIPGQIEVKHSQIDATGFWKRIDNTFTPLASHTLLVANSDSMHLLNSAKLNQETGWLVDASNYEHLDPDRLTLQEINERLRAATEKERIVYLPVLRSVEFPEIIPKRYLEKVSEGVNHPIYCSVTTLLGGGCLAGFGSSDRLFAKFSALAVLGKFDNNQAVGFEEAFLDDHLRKELGFAAPNWNSDVFVLNPQLTFWQANRQSILASSTLILLFGAIIGLLTRQRHQLKASRTDAEQKSSRLNYTLEGTNVGTWEWNVQTGETRFNERWAEIIGYTLAEISPTSIETWMKFAHPEDLQDSELRLQRHFEGESPFYELEARMQHKDGHWVWVLDRGKVGSWTPDGKPEWMYGTHQDISLRKLLEITLLERSRQAEDALKVKSNFLAAMSHEIRTPMNGVLGLADLAMLEQDADKQRDYIKGIRKSGQLLLDVLNDVLDYSRIEAGRTQLNNERFATFTVFDDCRDLFSAAAELKGLTLTLSIAADVPPVLIGDPIKLAQMTNNYIGNAIKFTSSGYIAIRVTATPDGVNNTILTVSCEDSGMGINQEDLASLFQPFNQVTKDSRKKASGSGLGLAIVKEYAVLMDGDCGVESEPGKGSRFWFQAQLTVPENFTDDLPETALAKVDHSSLIGQHLLVVDDNAINTQVMAATLRHYEMTCDTAENGVEAVRLVKESLDGKRKKYDVILMDVQMPVMNGLDAAKAIKAMPGEKPAIIGLTAAVEAEEKQAYMEAGMDGFSGKPIDTRKLFLQMLRFKSLANMVH